MMRTAEWFLPATVALLLWGVWGLFQKLATNQMPPKTVYLFATAGALLAVLVVLITTRIPPAATGRGVLFAVLAGFCSSLGGLLFLHALSRGKASIIITFTALYPLITIILSFTVLREAVTIKQGVGILLALAAMVLLAG